MIDNKITRKIKRLEELETIIESLNSRIENYEANVIQYKEKIEEYKKSENQEYNWELEHAQEYLNTYLIRMEEAKKLLTEIEKMA